LTRRRPVVGLWRDEALTVPRHVEAQIAAGARIGGIVEQQLRRPVLSVVADVSTGTAIIAVPCR
jgi:hypothetical protein